MTLAPLSHARGVDHGFFGRDGGVSEGVYASLNCGIGSKDVAERVAENRRRAAAALGLGPEALATGYQRHTTLVATVDEPWPAGQRPTVDGLVTARRGLGLGILTADCAPVLFADARAGVVGAAHAGWRGAKAGVIEAVIAAMEGLGASRPRIVAAVGPCIGRESYEVGEEFEAEFLAEETTNADFFRPGAHADKRLFDLAGYALRRLERAGIADAAAARRDTLADPGYFSYRRARREGAPDFGRLISLVALDARNACPTS
ncbi:MAG: peptidoglycan editing factor PgeF [Proteobacteria bacterium]|nr:peptidoglycan editing factor PgeF [Pseudomonadota bacterium]